jgi:hypothetical protein
MFTHPGTGNNFYNITVKLVDTQAIIAQRIRDALVNNLNSSLTKAFDPIKNRLGPIIEKGIKNTNEYTSIMSGILQGELGLIAPGKYLDNIINRIKETVFIQAEQISFSGSQLRGKINIGILVNNGEYEDLQQVRGASYTSHGFLIPWLKWMLVSGYAVISGYSITTDLNPEQAANSRSGKAIMIEGGNWTLISSRIPPQFVGYVGNNFLSRGIESVSDEILLVLEQEFSRII